MAPRNSLDLIVPGKPVMLEYKYVVEELSKYQCAAKSLVIIVEKNRVGLCNKSGFSYLLPGLQLAGCTWNFILFFRSFHLQLEIEAECISVEAEKNRYSDLKFEVSV